MKNYRHYHIDDFLADQAFQEWVLKPNPARNAFWKEFLQAHPEKAADVERARTLIQELKETQVYPSPEERKQVWEAIQAQLDQPFVPSHPQSYRKKYLRIISGAAAALLLLLVSWLLLNPSSPEVTHQTAYGETKEITLPDQSKVVLNANSRLRYQLVSHWGTSTREVWLEGEAYFQVKHLVDEQPFRVHSAEAIISVLGTKFNVNTRHHKTKVFLNSGKVSLSSVGAKNEKNRRPLLLKPGEVAEVRATGETTINPGQAAPHTSWTQQRFVFDNASLEEIAQLLEDLYGVDVIIQDPSLREKTFAASYPADLPILLEALEISLSLDIERKGQQISIKSRN